MLNKLDELQHEIDDFVPKMEKISDEFLEAYYSDIDPNKCKDYDFDSNELRELLVGCFGLKEIKKKIIQAKQDGKTGVEFL